MVASSTIADQRSALSNALEEMENALEEMRKHRREFEKTLLDTSVDLSEIKQTEKSLREKLKQIVKQETEYLRKKNIVGKKLENIERRMEVLEQLEKKMQIR
ncbi:MAG: hypothetical protein Q7S92_02005 [Candidatus Diapherotrites archaeon]|nr:hypothetical protein [Candidatus Diapherotrites archaeon]